MQRANPGTVSAIVYLRTAGGSIRALSASGPIAPASAATVSSHRLVDASALWMARC